MEWYSSSVGMAWYGGDSRAASHTVRLLAKIKESTCAVGNSSVILFMNEPSFSYGCPL